MTDVTLRDEGSIVLVTPVTTKAREWVDENVSLESYQWFAGGFPCETRYIGDLVNGMIDAGLEVKGVSL